MVGGLLSGTQTGPGETVRNLRSKQKELNRQRMSQDLDHMMTEASTLGEAQLPLVSMVSSTLDDASTLVSMVS